MARYWHHPRTYLPAPQAFALVQRYPGPGAPLRAIVALGTHGDIGRWVRLECQHWRQIWGYGLPDRPRPTRSRCGLCRDGIPSDYDPGE